MVTLRQTIALTLLFFGALLCVYWEALGHFFIADDLCDLVFLRQARENIVEFLNPTLHFSDSSTKSRYLPLSLLFRVARNLAFEMSEWKYRIASYALHAVNAGLVCLIALELFKDRVVAVSSATVFLLYRVHAQAVVWISAGHILLSAFFFFVALLSWMRGGRMRTIASPSFYLVALLLHPTVLVFPVIAGLYSWFTESRIPWRSLAGLLAATAIAVLLNIVSLRYFPTTAPGYFFELKKLLGFLASLAAPFDVPTSLRLGIVAITAIWCLSSRDGRLMFLLAGMIAGGLFWNVFGKGYPLTPRYFYLYVPFASMMLVVIAKRGLAAVGEHLRLRWSLERWGTVVFALTLGLVHVRALRAYDLFYLEWKQTETHDLFELMIEAQSEGRTKPVAVEPRLTLPACDRTFFENSLILLRPGQSAVDAAVTNTGEAAYSEKLMTKFSRKYWTFPWLLDNWNWR